MIAAVVRKISNPTSTMIGGWQSGKLKSLMLSFCFQRSHINPLSSSFVFTICIFIFIFHVKSHRHMLYLPPNQPARLIPLPSSNAQIPVHAYVQLHERVKRGLPFTLHYSIEPSPRAHAAITCMQDRHWHVSLRRRLFSSSIVCNVVRYLTRQEA